MWRQVGFALASFRFFTGRIEDEEYQLIRFFGEQYVQYQARVPIGMAAVSLHDCISPPHRHTVHQGLPRGGLGVQVR